jgi:hypothetical protein
MAAVSGRELDILVEDEVAKSLLQASLPTSIRSRVEITVIGSAKALSRQLAAIYIRGEERPTMAVFDGDQRIVEDDNLEHAKKMAESVEANFSDWFKSRTAYLPGDTWPEAWIVQKSSGCIDAVSKLTSSDPDVLTDILEYGLQAGKHNEFFEIAKNLGLDQRLCLQLFTAGVSQSYRMEFDGLIAQINDVLTNNG